MSGASNRPIIRPTLAFALAHPAHFLALGFGTGLAPVAPGTFGTLVAFPLYALLALWLGSAGILLVAAGMFVAGIWLCGRTSRALGLSDHSAINWDEIVAFLAVLAFTPTGWLWDVAAFLLFRFFDVVKPPPIRYFDQTVKGGFGVMLDDVLAAGYTVLVLAIAKFLLF
jgi:phosphatidylglycerophosphatase A